MNSKAFLLPQQPFAPAKAWGKIASQKALGKLPSARAQAGLEYLMTYGWALILVATIITVLVFVVGKPGPSVAFNVSDPTKFLLKSAGISGNTAGIVLQNATGGRILLKSISFSGDLGYAATAKLNGRTVTAGEFPIEILSGGEIRMEGLNASNNCANAGVTINYTDPFGFDRAVNVTSGGAAGAIASFSLDDITNCCDWSAKGTPNGGLAYAPITCPNGKCLSFNGTNTYIVIPNNPKLQQDFNSGVLTVSAWVHPISFMPVYSGILSKSLGGGVATLSFDISTYLQKVGVNVGNGVTPYLSAYSAPTTIIANKWQHVAVTLDGSNIKLYVNGAQSGSTVAQTKNPMGTTTPIRIGQAYHSYSFDGYIDEMTIYNRAISASEICNDCKRFAANVSVVCNC